ncbi:MAG: hypothetical protein K2M17_04645 [Bacilli bacterium]|nr:hypothetical protein [Bacilli bacterium]
MNYLFKEDNIKSLIGYGSIVLAVVIYLVTLYTYMPMVCVVLSIFTLLVIGVNVLENIEQVHKRCLKILLIISYFTIPLIYIFTNNSTILNIIGWEIGLNIVFLGIATAIVYSIEYD